MYQRLKKRAFEVLEIPRADDPVSRTVDAFLVALILLNVLASILHSVEWMYR